MAQRQRDSDDGNGDGQHDGDGWRNGNGSGKRKGNMTAVMDKARATVICNTMPQTQCIRKYMFSTLCHGDYGVVVELSTGA